MPPRDQRKTELLEATLRVIAQGGVDAVRARRVAAEAQVPLGSISYWFDGREDLIRAAFVHFLQSNTGFLEGLLAQCPVNTQGCLVELLVTMVEVEFADRGRVVAEYELLLAASRDRILAEALALWEQELLGGLAELLEGLGCASATDSARTLVEFIRGYELLVLTRPAPDLKDLRVRLTPLIGGLVAANKENA